MVNTVFDKFFEDNPDLIVCKNQIKEAYELLKDTYDKKGKLLTCGNGGSASDSEHIVGELMKGFVLPRTYSSKTLSGEKLQYGLPAISLVSQSALISAISNDNGADLIYAQQVLGYGRIDDSILGISTSGNSKNVVNAIKMGKELGLHTIGLTGRKGGVMAELCDICIRVPADETYKIQEYHLPIYHLLCMMLEYNYFG